MRAAVINDKGEVVNIIVADAAVDTLSGYVLVNCSEQITNRHIWTGQEFVPNAELQAELDAEEAAFQEMVWEEIE